MAHENNTALKVWRILFVSALLILGAILGLQVGLMIVQWATNPYNANSVAVASRDSLSGNGKATAYAAFTLLGILIARLLSTSAFQPIGAGRRPAA